MNEDQHIDRILSATQAERQAHEQLIRAREHARAVLIMMGVD